MTALIIPDSCKSHRCNLWCIFLTAVFLTIWQTSAAPKIVPGAPSPYTGTIQATKLYTASDGPGSIKGQIVTPPSEVLGVFAVSREKHKTVMTTKLLQGGTREDAKYRIAVYIAHLNDDNSFIIKGMQEGIYDLLVLCSRGYYNGLQLNRRGSDLTAVDKKTITDKINLSNPYFNQKHIARMAGGTGRAAKARVLVQEVRTLPITLQDASTRHDIQTRSIKLFLMEDVQVTGSPAWSVEETREIVRQEVGPPDLKGALPEYFCKALNGILVVDATEDVGNIRLTKDTPPETR
ncbi:MAG: hypothetical protein GX230_09725 [Lentisphaerae bacterium]|jgi:hypothetical protein|nr:hypothetical protein [Lentisphaerota bacterium]